jgi:hypothetical protein
MPYRVYDENNQLIGYLEDDAEIERWLAELPEDYYTFSVGGTSADTERLMLRLNSRAAGDSFFDLLKQKHGRVPLRLNAFAEIRDLVFGRNAFFIKVRESFTDLPLLGQLLTVLKNTLAAGATFFLILEPKTLQEEFDTDTIGEQLQVFYVPTVTDEFADLGEVLFGSLVVS